MNTLIKIISFILLISGALLGNNTPTEGSSLQVLAPSGLKLRTQPSMDAPTITVMPHGAEVQLIAFENDYSLSRVEWVDGKWIKVEYNGTVGWAFDGFLTILNVPSHELEKCYGDMDLLYPLEFWTRANFGAEKIDTVTDEMTYVRTHYSLIDNQNLIITERDLSSTLELHLKDVRVMEVYQLLESMITTKSLKNVFKESSIFIEKDGVINHVKINAQDEIDIRQSYDGTVRVLINSYQGC